MLNNAYDKNSQNRNPDILNEAVIAADKDKEEGGSLVPRFVAPTHTGVDILKLLSELEDMVEGTRRLPGGILLRFDDEKFHYIIMKIRANLPEEMKQASKLARDSQRIVDETRESADRVLTEARQRALQEMESGKRDAELRYAEAMKEVERVKAEAAGEGVRLREAARAESVSLIEEARAHANRLIGESEIIRQAQERARETLLRAEDEAEAVRQGADDYARDLLLNLEGVLGKAVFQVQAGRELLEQAR